MGRVTILNLGCGARTSPRCVNVDWSVHLLVAKNPLLRLGARLLYGPERLKAIAAVRTGALRHDLTKGIPFPDASVDAVYQGYFLPTIARDLENPAADPALRLLRECFRVLRPGGVLRVSVPDFEAHCRRYVDHLDRCAREPALRPETDERLSHVIGMAVRREPGGSALQRPWVRVAENLLLGDARRRGQTHRWDYDRFNLAELFSRAGFSGIETLDYATSRIPDWSAIGLDRREDGSEYKSPSLYIEGRK